MILDEGYGTANRAAHIPNRPNTEYGLADATTTALITADTLQVSQRQKVYDWISNVNAPILSPPPGSLLRADVQPSGTRSRRLQLVEGTSSLPNYRWGDAREQHCPGRGEMRVPCRSNASAIP